eukprot:comp20757_c0_seq1/m.27211 comp20757_c0_seq1/g.27211  ORF comp20757_c0_seq1/g.27211 comp20757_c0_seq1/m.27211 type:complete len:473 (-) comp20757_c0_seq1:518-1936(-)
MSVVASTFQGIVRAHAARQLVPSAQFAARAAYSHLVASRSDRHVAALYRSVTKDLPGPVQSKMQVRHMSVFQEFLNNVKKGFEGSKELKESVDKVKAAEKKVEDAEALRRAKEAMDKTKETLDKTKEEAEKVAAKASGLLSEQWGRISSLFGKVAESDVVKTTAKVTEQVAQEAKKTAEEVEKELGKTKAFQKVTETVDVLKKELVDESILSSAKYQPYRKPSKEEMQKLTLEREKPAVTIEENKDATGMVMHKSSIFEQRWRDFKDNNQLINRAFEWKMYYDESDNIFIRSMRSITDKISEGLGSMFKESELMTVMKEIRKYDPSFDKEDFIEHAHKTLIPVLLESYLSADLKTLEKWCSEATYNVLCANLKQHTDMGLKTDYKILDIRDVDVFNALMTEHGPVLTVTCMVQQIMVSRNMKGEIVEGDPDNIEDVLYAFAFCREEDPTVPLGTKAAWKVMDFAVHLRRPTW